MGWEMLHETVMLSRLTDTQMHCRLLHSVSLQVTGVQNPSIVSSITFSSFLMIQGPEASTKKPLNAKASASKNYTFLHHSLHTLGNECNGTNQQE